MRTKLLALVLSLFACQAHAKVKYFKSHFLNATSQSDIELHRFYTVDVEGRLKTWLAPSIGLSTYLTGNQTFSIKVGIQGLLASYDQTESERMNYKQVSPQLAVEYRGISFWYPNLVAMGTFGSGKMDDFKLEDRGMKAELKNIIPLNERFALSLSVGMHRFKRYFFEKHEDIDAYARPKEYKKRYGYMTFGVTAWII
ncbi:hypothetical protein [Pseudobacteriovorax antillogorgiicola]|uniref:Outer membrane protein beta-barrel domain-containing protein n=1 Tax=Pseudobacteriovorax antillogorgiicola TaxID=1513793 RepID=A0A1Y6CDI6_9BACT|nr:hypothetical protein [Pseudobacteriovorax antillogorgiicola]TCS48238.1 hypothetical protein EDD56_11818 [Pseudobacteriovorax antillogorgiicola]SMF57296.1 hypothetical protein SAMN06296036_118123 [Pseudobacteriovorax antillogorgiicola]